MRERRRGFDNAIAEQRSLTVAARFLKAVIEGVW